MGINRAAHAITPFRIDKQRSTRKVPDSEQQRQCIGVVCQLDRTKTLSTYAGCREPKAQFFTPGSELCPRQSDAHIRFTLEY